MERKSQERRVVRQVFTSFSYIQNQILQNSTYFLIEKNCTVPEYSMSVCLFASFFLCSSVFVCQRKSMSFGFRRIP